MTSLCSKLAMSVWYGFFKGLHLNVAQIARPTPRGRRLSMRRRRTPSPIAHGDAGVRRMHFSVAREAARHGAPPCRRAPGRRRFRLGAASARAKRRSLPSASNWTVSALMRPVSSIDCMKGNRQAEPQRRECGRRGDGRRGGLARLAGRPWPARLPAHSRPRRPPGCAGCGCAAVAPRSSAWCSARRLAPAQRTRPRRWRMPPGTPQRRSGFRR